MHAARAPVLPAGDMVRLRWLKLEECVQQAVLQSGYSCSLSPFAGCVMLHGVRPIAHRYTNAGWLLVCDA
jgi:hypothetical protein